MPHFPILPLAAAALISLGAAPLLAQSAVPAPDAAAAQSASIAPVAMLTEGGPALGAASPLLWELFTPDARGNPDERVAHGAADAPLAVPPGDYILLATLDMARAAQPVTLRAGPNTVPPFVLNAGLVELTPELQVAGTALNGGAVYLTTATRQMMSYLGPVRAYVPAGEITATVTFDAIRLQERLQVVAGETVTRKIGTAAGIAEVRLSTGNMAIPAAVKPRIDIFTAPDAAGGGAPRSVVFDMLAERSFILPPGDYVAQGLVQGASVKVPFSLRGGEAVQVALDLPVGLLSIAAPGANSLAVMAATDDAAEPWRLIFHQFDLTALDYIVPAGDYLIEAHFESGKVEKTAQVAAGATVAVEVP